MSLKTFGVDCSITHHVLRGRTPARLVSAGDQPDVELGLALHMAVLVAAERA